VKRVRYKPIYKKAQKELDGLNAQYPKQRYSLFKLVFSATAIRQQYPQVQRYKRKSMMLAEGVSPSIAVSNEIKLNALVTVASNRSEK